MLRFGMTLDHYSPPAALPYRDNPSTVSAPDSPFSLTRSVPTPHLNRPLFSHTYKPLLPQPLCFEIDTNCRVPTPASQRANRNALISNVIYYKQTWWQKERPRKNVLKQRKSPCFVASAPPANL